VTWPTARWAVAHIGRRLPSTLLRILIVLAGITAATLMLR
jgi:hypothetical protein